ncbi:MAG: hypothetical protein L3K05_04570, partial [Thermoplasmata archaeon]|nr:hypothetical protein [Thermoplasmata archaeon]
PLGGSALLVALAGFFFWSILDGLVLVALGVVLGLVPKYRTALGLWIMILSLLSLAVSSELLFAAVVGVVGGAMAIRLELAVDAPADSLRFPSRPRTPSRVRSGHLPTTRVARETQPGVHSPPVSASNPDRGSQSTQ